jgi:hypothetical protein
MGFVILFVIVVEALSRMLSTPVGWGFLTGFSVGSRHSGVGNISLLLRMTLWFAVGPSLTTFTIHMLYFYALKLSSI